ncbi:MAG: ABC transporter ATP-binding protein [Ardenticatenaceae bacterium]|nr:ABC transporter ATP-binding protein [Ardenticatenaceae bacterium]
MITTENLGKSFDDFEAVRDLNIQVAQGELLALLGPNGAGKTTTVRMLGSILKPSVGSAAVNGYDVVTQADKVRRSIGMLTEQPGLYLRMSGLEYLLFYGRLYGMSDNDIKQRGLALFDRFNMPNTADRRLGQYSKGMRQKVGLIRSMLHNPAVLLLDEPTSAMDPHSAKLVRDAIREMRDGKRSVILCTHNLAEAELLADRIAIIRQGRIVAEGKTAELKQKLLGQPRLEVRVDRSLNGQIQEIESLVTVESVIDNVIRYRTEQPDVTNPMLVRCLNDLGLGIIALQEVSQTLEEVYLRVIADGDAIRN